MFATFQALAPVFALALALAASPVVGPPKTASPDVASGLESGREGLARYQWRLRTEMKVDGISRLTKVEDAHLGPDGGLVTKKTVKYDKRPDPTPLPSNDPRSSSQRPLSSLEEERLAEAAMEVMQLYARLSPDVARRWQEGAELLPPDPDRPGLVRMKGRGLGRPQDEATLYLDEKSRLVAEIEVKTTVAPEIRDIAFLRAKFERIPVPGAPPGLRVPGRIFLNMQFQGRRVTLEMTTTDYRSWP
ncbi:MAG TPA: hypothetical protein VE129_18360 [Thermoanaerobaculia bacterium]|nr:hypothetical protein [Thermoanaerobaculia bacterium]